VFTDPWPFSLDGSHVRALRRERTASRFLLVERGLQGDRRAGRQRPTDGLGTGARRGGAGLVSGFPAHPDLLSAKRQPPRHLLVHSPGGSDGDEDVVARAGIGKPRETGPPIQDERPWNATVSRRVPSGRCAAKPATCTRDKTQRLVLDVG